MNKANYSTVTTLLGMSHTELKAFSWNNLRHFFRVSLWDRSHLCAACGREILSINKATLDHILPKSLGGRTRLCNLQLMHMKCNSRKGREMPVKYHPKARTPVSSHRDYR